MKFFKKVWRSAKNVFNNYHDKVASAATILSLILAWYIYIDARMEQKIEENRFRYALLDSLASELDKGIKVCDALTNKRGKQLDDFFFQRLPTIVLHQSIEESWLISSEIGPELLEINQSIVLMNKILDETNSASFALVQPATFSSRKESTMLQNQKRLLILKDWLSRTKENTLSLKDIYK
ncbi:hypothetical protein FX988_00173 [Paraglaciecola mesophila]|uniref:Uncharacterized protein n=1 Tax=Paraglaciecola mesophila TaxID=197222 RepID=A0A857JH06_9ALTE|nr:hypothetical protein [Paraglaciecola mesophila]QHJ09964.1 hypothetical protein FX988_00173 [Paraglaciecola mesophila]